MSKRHGEIVVIRESCKCGAKFRACWSKGRWINIKNIGQHTAECIEESQNETKKQHNKEDSNDGTRDSKEQA